MRVNVPEYKTFVDFPDNTSPEEIQKVMTKNFPHKPTFIEQLVEDYKTGKQILSQPTAPATSRADWATRVLPESLNKAVVGMAEMPMNLYQSLWGKPVGQAVTGHPIQAVVEAGKGIYETARGLTEPTSRLLGFDSSKSITDPNWWSLQNIKNLALTDPATMAIGAAPLAGGLMSLLKKPTVVPEATWREFGEVPQYERLALPPGQGFELKGKPTIPTEKGAPMYTRLAPIEKPVERLLLPYTGEFKGKKLYEPESIFDLPKENIPKGILFAKEKVKAAIETPGFLRTAEEKAILRSTLGNESGAIDLGAFADVGRKIRDYVTIESLPKLSRFVVMTGKNVADSGVEHASARTAVPRITNDLLAKVFPTSYKKPAIMSKTIDILNKDNILAGYDSFLARANDALREGDKATYQKWTEVADAVALKHDLNAYDTVVRTARNNPEIMGNINRWKENVNPFLDRLYNEVKRVDSLTDREGRGRYFDTRINLLTKDKEAMWTEALSNESKPLPEASVSNYRNPNVKHDPYDRMAKFTGEYSTDAQSVLNGVLGHRYNEATKIKFYNDLVTSGAAIEVKPGVALPLKIKGQEVSSLPIKVPQTGIDGVTKQVEKTLLVRRDIVPEIRGILNTDLQIGQNIVGKILTDIQLAQIADAVTHTKNIITVVTKAQGAGSAFADVSRSMPMLGTVDAIGRIAKVTNEIIADTPAIRAEMAEMAKQGLLRVEYPPTGITTITHGQQAIYKVDTASRIIMNRFFNNLVERGLVKDTIAERRGYVNQIGQYNRRLMGPFMKFMRDSGLSPFIVAGRNYNKQGRAALTGALGINPASKAANIQMRTINLLRVGLLFTVPMMLNTITTGNPNGRSGTPLGAWDLGWKEDEKGKHKTIDLLQVTGVRRGMRSIGLEALIEGIRSGETINEIAGKAKEQIGQAAVHPWLGPGIGGAAAALTGRRLDLRGQMQAMRIPEGGGKQDIENVRAALKSQNPLIYSAVRPMFQSIGLDQEPDDPYLENVGKTFLKSPYTAFGVKDTPSAAMQEMSTIIGAKGLPGVTPEGAARKKLKVDFAGKPDNEIGQIISNAVDSKIITDKEADALWEHRGETSLMSGFKFLSVPEAIRVWKKATPDEQDILYEAFGKKIDNAYEADKLDEKTLNKLNILFDKYESIRK